MSTNNVQLLQFKIYCHLKKKSTFNADVSFPFFLLNCDNFEEKSLKFVLFQSPFCLFPHQNTLNNLPFCVLWSLTVCDHNHQTRFIVVYSTPINAKSRFVNLNYVTYTQPMVALRLPSSSL